MSTAEQPPESATKAAQPGLYDPGDATPQLAATTCDACATVSFPPMTIGCEVCGAAEDQLRATAIAAAGTLSSVATVHLHRGKDIEAPFTMAEIKLDAGPLIRATLLDVVEADAIGQRVEAQWVEIRTDDDGSAIVEPRFALRSPSSTTTSPARGVSS